MIQADNAVMALLVGAQLAYSSLSIAQGSSVSLSAMFPGVRHIERFQLRPDRARRELAASEEHLARIAIPYALSVHEDYVTQVKDDLVGISLPLALQGRRWNAENMHAILLDSLGQPSLPDLTTFEALRRLRNSLIHSGGVVDAYVEAGINMLSPDALTRWEQVAGRPPGDSIKSGTVDVGAGEVMLAFSAARHLSLVLHDATLTAFPASFWLNDCVDDFLRGHRETLRSGRLLRAKLEHYAEQYYEDFAFTWSELFGAAQRAGVPANQLRRRGER